MQTIATARLTLEPQVEAHAAQMFAVLSDPAIYEYENAPPESLEWLRTRFARLESRVSPDGSEKWLNWVIRTGPAQLAGYVQATIRTDGEAAIAYELSSQHWGRGLASEAVTAMMGALREEYGVQKFSAVLKHNNMRSLRVLERLGFSLASAGDHATRRLEPGELLLQMPPYA